MSLIADIVLEKARDSSVSPTIHTYTSRCSEYPTFLQVIEELCKDCNIWQMLYASDCGRPAIEPVIRTIENICRTSGDFDIFNEDKAKQALGVIVKIIMELYGYAPTGISEEIFHGYSESIKSARVYDVYGK